MRTRRVLSVLLSMTALLVLGTGIAAAQGPIFGPDADDPGGGGGELRIWQQEAEKASGTYNKTYASHWYTSQYACDADPDYDYVFVYNLNYQQNPDSLKFYTDDVYIRIVVLPDRLKTFAFAWTECRMCVGPDRISLISGGAETFRSKVWLHQVP